MSEAMWWEVSALFFLSVLLLFYYCFTLLEVEVRVCFVWVGCQRKTIRLFISISGAGTVASSHPITTSIPEGSSYGAIGIVLF